MIYLPHLRGIIRKVLKKHHLYSKNAAYLCICTIANESHGGTYTRQKVRNFAYRRHALSIVQMEKNTFDWLVTKYAKKYPILARIKFRELETNLEYAILLCRLRYLAIREYLPNRFVLHDIWKYYKRYYNTYQGSATKQEFTENVRKYAGTPTK